MYFVNFFIDSWCFDTIIKSAFVSFSNSVLSLCMNTIVNWLCPVTIQNSKYFLVILLLFSTGFSTYITMTVTDDTFFPICMLCYSRVRIREESLVLLSKVSWTPLLNILWVSAACMPLEVEVMEFQWSYSKSWKMMLWKCCTQYASKFGQLSSGHKSQFSFQSQRKSMPKNAQTTAQLHSSHTLVK